MGRYGGKAINAEGQMVADFATSMEMAVVNRKAYGRRDWRRRGGICRRMKRVNNIIRRCDERGSEGKEQGI